MKDRRGQKQSKKEINKKTKYRRGEKHRKKKIETKDRGGETE